MCLFCISSYLNRGVVILSFFLEKNETKKSSLLSNRSAFKGVRSDKSTLRVIDGGCFA